MIIQSTDQGLATKIRNRHNFRKNSHLNKTQQKKRNEGAKLNTGNLLNPTAKVFVMYEATLIL